MDEKASCASWCDQLQKGRSRSFHGTFRILSQQRFTIQLKNRFQVIAVEEQMTDEGEEQEDQVERKSKIMEGAYVKTAEEVLGYKKKKNKSWFCQEA